MFFFSVSPAVIMLCQFSRKPMGIVIIHDSPLPKTSSWM